MAKKSKSAVKPSMKSRTLNPTGNGKPKSIGKAPSIGKNQGDAFNDQDVKRRLGNFEGAGEHARVGGRNGIIGQTTKKSRTDNKKKS